jgi:VIT1/CCC1 family predicted Fe2+/Mn2+ transporter
MTTASGAPDGTPREAPDRRPGETPDPIPGAAPYQAQGDAPGRATGEAKDRAPHAPERIPDDAHDEMPGHQHRDVSGGWLRPAVFGAMDGLVTNASLIAGVGGGMHAVSGSSSGALILTGLAGLAAGAFSMATGEFVSVSSQNELVDAEVGKERLELANHPDAERRELAAVFVRRGVDADLADQVARQISAHPEQALRVHVSEELGVDHQELPSPVTAAGASLVTFAIGALIPLLPYLAGFGSLRNAMIFAAVAAFAGGGLVSRITNRPFLSGAMRQLVLAAIATGLTYGIGVLVGTAIT